MNTITIKQPLLVVIQIWYVFLAYFFLEKLVSTTSLVLSITLISTSVCALTAAYYPRMWTMRVVVALLTMCNVYFLAYSPVKTNHGLYFPMYLSLVLAVSSMVDLKKTLWWSQAVILSTYLLAGFWKLNEVIGQCATDRMSQCHISGFSELVAHRVLETSSIGVLTKLVVETPFLGFFGLWAVTLLQCSSIFVFILFPRSKAYIAGSLIIFHLLVYLILDISFFMEMALLFIIFIFPYAIDPQFDTDNATATYWQARARTILINSFWKPLHE